MKILQVIHGYPMRFNAGSEVYTQTLCHELANRHEVHVFTREEDAFAPELSLRVEPDASDPRVMLHLLNNPQGRDRYRNPAVDGRFADLLDRLRPDVVHVGHLLHLSTSLVYEVAARRIPLVFTLHDYWIMCPRGQFMQQHGEPGNPWPVCDGQADRKCAERCYAARFAGKEGEDDVGHWTHWVSRRMEHSREIAELVDVFIAPSPYLLRRFRDQFGIPEEKLVQLECGLDTTRLRGRRRSPGEAFTFGYIGTHIPAKGVQHLIEAFGMLQGAARLRIWGRPRAETEALKSLARRFVDDVAGRVEWRGEYRNQDIVRDVFDHVDAIVVPSIWVENSPLVIREAQHARVPVITANAGGMAELVHHEVNGLVFEHRNPSELAKQMQRYLDDPQEAERLGGRGYLHSDNGDVPDIREHAVAVERIYRHVCNAARS
jgi:glycosyltransferase involved in cell wall biosynthesis